jgi:hypothetical protein
MASFGVEQDIPPGVTLTVGGTIALANAGQISQQNTANSVPGALLNSYATVAANATGTQASGTAIVAAQNGVSSGGAAYSVTLPVSTPGTQIDIVCTSATNTVAVFPNAGGTGSEKINALSANGGITMAALTSTTFICMVAGQWYTSPRVPS